MNTHTHTRTHADNRLEIGPSPVVDVWEFGVSDDVLGQRAGSRRMLGVEVDEWLIARAHTQIHMNTHMHRHTDTHTDTHIDTHTQTQAQTQAQTHTQTHRHTHFSPNGSHHGLADVCVCLGGCSEEGDHVQLMHQALQIRVCDRRLEVSLQVTWSMGKRKVVCVQRGEDVHTDTDTHTDRHRHRHRHRYTLSPRA